MYIYYLLCYVPVEWTQKNNQHFAINIAITLVGHKNAISILQ